MINKRNRGYELNSISQLPKLILLDITGNSVEDLRPLFTSTNLLRPEYRLLAKENPLGPNALCADIPEIEKRGANVEYDGECGDPAN